MNETAAFVLRADGTIEEPTYVADPETGGGVIFADGFVLREGDRLIITSEIEIP